MKLFAITPDYFTVSDVLESLPGLKDLGVYGLYLRTGNFHGFFKDIIPAADDYGIISLIPIAETVNLNADEYKFGIHFRSFETDLLSRHSFSADALITASCHSLSRAALLLEKNHVQYVFVSPVFTPFSKPGDKRKLLDRGGLKLLINRFGERVILLGGQNMERINDLIPVYKNNFSAAGISMFFPDYNKEDRKI